jgi:protein polybromo-1
LCSQVVTNPIDLLKLQQKLKTDEYEDVDELTTDVQLMVNNAKAFYKVIASNPLLTLLIYSLFKLNLFGDCSGRSTVC